MTSVSISASLEARIAAGAKVLFPAERPSRLE